MISRLYSTVEAAEVLKVPVSWLRGMVGKRAVPHTRLGRHVRFTDAHLAEIVAQGERSAAPAAPRTATPTGRARRRHPAAPAR